MLPPNITDRYQKFQQALEELLLSAAQEKADLVKLRETFAEVQQIFQSQIASLSSDDLDSATSARVQSYLTEIDKQLRLLGMDVMFLQAARRTETAQARLVQISDRLHTLIAYCQALLQTQ